MTQLRTTRLRTTVLRRTLAVVVSAAALAALSALSRRPYATGARGAVLRLSWRARGEEVERCRRATEAELANLPAHMRQTVVCDERRVAPYRLRVRVDGRELADEPAPGSGVSGDRAMILLRDHALDAGTHRLEVSLDRVRADGEASDDADEGEDEGGDDALDARMRRRRAIPPHLALDTVLAMPVRSITLVTYSSELRRLVVMSPAH